jgi:catechol 2,3-dioxygenase-like lactoylglutathione lyase family enzyme
MLDHMSIQVADMEASATFYDLVLAPLGYERVLDFGEVVGFGRDERPQFWLGPVTTSGEAREVHVAFEAAEVLHEPRVFPEYHPNYFGAFVRDLDGNNVEVVCHLPS